MRRKKLLLAATALAGCSKAKEPEPLPGNPKGTKYDAAQATPDAAPIDAEINMPANPKGTFYDAGLADEKPQPPADAAIDAATKRDAGAPVDAPVINRLPANPKGSLYDKGKKKPGPATDF